MHSSQTPQSGATVRCRSQAPQSGTAVRYRSQAPQSGTAVKHRSQAPQSGTAVWHRSLAPQSGAPGAPVRRSRQALQSGAAVRCRNQIPQSGALVRHPTHYCALTKTCAQPRTQPRANCAQLPAQPHAQLEHKWVQLCTATHATGTAAALHTDCSSMANLFNIAPTRKWRKKCEQVEGRSGGRKSLWTDVEEGQDESNPWATLKDMKEGHVGKAHGKVWIKQ
jgi:hypothetical protein